MKKNVLSVLLVLTLIPSASFANPINIQKEIVEDVKIVSPEIEQRNLSEMEEAFILKGKIALEAFLQKNLDHLYADDYIRDVYIPEESPDITDEYIYVNFHSLNPDSNFYSISFNKNTGKVISISSYVYYDEKIKPTYSNEEARKTAISFANSLKPGKDFSEEYFEEGQQKQYFSTVFGVKENNIETDFNYIYVTVDKVTGKISSFYAFEINEDVTFEDFENILSKEKALEIMKKNAKANLRYFYDFEKKLAIPVYEISFEGSDSIAAKDGKKRFEANLKELNKKLDLNASKIELNNLDKVIEYVEKELNVELLQNEEPYSYDNVFSYSFKEKGSEESIFSINMKGDKFIGFNYYNSKVEYDKDGKFKGTNVSHEKAYEIAVSYLEKLAGDKIKELNPVNYQDMSYVDEYSDSYYFNFQRTIDSIDFPDNGVHISINKESGKINSFYINWDENISYEKLKKESIRRQEAIDKFFKEKEIKLIYSLNEDMKIANLYYVFIYSYHESNIIDANTGEFIKQFYRIMEEPMLD